jgi:hypothetical protein
MRRQFEDYVYMQSEINQLLSEDTSASDVARGSSVDAPYTQHTIRVSGVDLQYAAWIAERVETLRGKCAEVEAAIALAPNSLLRLILTYRYKQGIENWDKVAEKLPTKKSGGACRKMAHRYIDGLSE